jgi:hypothetical protein
VAGTSVAQELPSPRLLADIAERLAVAFAPRPTAVTPLGTVVQLDSNQTIIFSKNYPSNSDDPQSEGRPRVAVLVVRAIEDDRGDDTWILTYGIAKDSTEIEAAYPYPEVLRVELYEIGVFDNPLFSFEMPAEYSFGPRALNEPAVQFNYESTGSLKADWLTTQVERTLYLLEHGHRLGGIDRKRGIGPHKWRPVRNAPNRWLISEPNPSLQLTSEEGINNEIEDSHETPDRALDIERLRVDRDEAIRQLLGELASTQASIEQARSRMNEIVEGARQLDVTWAAIGSALNITGETAYQRFSPRGRESHRKSVARRRGANADTSEAGADNPEADPDLQAGS